MRRARKWQLRGSMLRGSIQMCTLLALGASMAASVAGAQREPGFTYTIRVTGNMPGGMMPGVTGGPDAQGYTGQVSATARRGRLDVTSGSIPGLLAKGDYILFDSTAMAIVHPTDKTFAVLGPDASSAAMTRLESMGVTLHLSDEKVTLDSLGGGDTISGTLTKRYRLTVAFNMAMEAPTMTQRLGSETVTDYWVGTVPGMPPNPLLRSNGLGGGMTGMFKSLSERVDSVSRRMGPTVALRTISTVRINGGPGQIIETKQSSEVSDIRRTEVDASRLVVPAAYTAVPLPGAETTAGDAAKWKAAPPVK